MDNLFIIAAGGTGAKVAESFIHLCAAGLGPEQADILLVDVDRDNGNVARARETAELYEAMRRWPWGVAPASNANNNPKLFGTDIRWYVLLDELTTVGKFGLKGMTPDSMCPVLDLFYDEDEQRANCKKGFIARPNLGSLIMAGHLTEAFKARAEKDPHDARAFIKRLKDSLIAATPTHRVPVAVVGSVFGGTGASVLPGVPRCLAEALSDGDTPAEREAHAAANAKKLRLCAFMFLPYFQPKDHSSAGTSNGTPAGTARVDGTRFLLDTANTLTYYEESEAWRDYQAIYLLGSDRPEETRFEYCEGAKDQANPPLLEDLIGALGLRNCAFPPDKPGTVWVFNPPAEIELFGWRELPGQLGRDLANFGLLLHVAAFFLSPGSSDKPLGRGIAAYLDQFKNADSEIELFPWFDSLLDRWAHDNFEPYRAANGSRWRLLFDNHVISGGACITDALGTATQYFTRLLCWAEAAMASGPGVCLIEPSEPGKMDCLRYWEAMSKVKADEIDSRNGGSDNALIRIIRASATGVLHIANDRVPIRKTVEKLGKAGLPGYPGSDAKTACALPMTAPNMESLASVRNQYRGTVTEHKTL